MFQDGLIRLSFASTVGTERKIMNKRWSLESSSSKKRDTQGEPKNTSVFLQEEGQGESV